MRRLRWGLLLAVLSAVPMFAADAVIQGTVTDNSGKPIRAALVRVSAHGKSVSRFTQANGHYEIAVPAGSYEVYSEAYGFGGKRQTKDTAQPGDINFSLSPSFSVARLTSAEIDSLIPNDPQAVMVKSTCINCHGLGTLLLKRGSASSDWQEFLPGMTQGRMFNPKFSPAKLQALGAALEKYFGPEAQYFGPDAAPPKPDQVQHAPIADAVLQATVREYNLPNPLTMPHSMTVDQNGTPWFAMYDYATNAIASFDPVAETFHTFPLQTPRVAPHTPCVGPDGKVWMPLNAATRAKLASVNPKTGEVKEYFWDAEIPGGHTCAADRDGNIWISSLSEKNAAWVFDVHKEQFRAYHYPIPDAYPPGVKGYVEQAPGEKDAVTAGAYDIKTDSQGKVWLGIYNLGWIVKIDPATGQTQEYKPPISSIRGMFVDSHDNVWFSAYNSHKLGKLDPTTGAVKLYQPPTADATPYGIVEDHRNGDLWFADLNGNHMTRFDPRTGVFTEYPIPTRNASSRFIGIDPQGRVWFTEFFTGKIGVVDPGDDVKVAAAR